MAVRQCVTVVHHVLLFRSLLTLSCMISNPHAAVVIPTTRAFLSLSDRRWPFSALTIAMAFSRWMRSMGSGRAAEAPGTRAAS